METTTVVLVATIAILIIVIGWLYWQLSHLRHQHRQQTSQLNDQLSRLQQAYAVLQAQTQQLEQQCRLQTEALHHQQAQYKAQGLQLIETSNQGARLKAQLEAAQQQAQHYHNQWQQLQSQYNQLQQQYQQLQQQTAQQQAYLQNQQQKLREQQQFIQQQSQELKQHFKALADEVLTAKAQSFTQQQEGKLTDLLQPMRQQLEGLKTDLLQTMNHAHTERTRLEEQLRQMAGLNQQLSTQAQQLTNALTQQVKQQGTWGEALLETILQLAGLQKNMHYQLQQTHHNPEGQAIRPDVIVHCPNQRFVVIDSKVSLVHYLRLQQTQEQEEQARFMRAMLQSLKQHIDGLASKKYHQIEGTLDFVLLFVPIEAAYITTLQQDQEIWQYAFSKKILLVSPTLLLSTLKIIAELWKQEAAQKNAQQMAQRAAKLHDKLMGFMHSFEEVGKRLQQAQQAFAQADGQLRYGKGNTLWQAEQLKLLQQVAAHPPAEQITEQPLVQPSLSAESAD